MTIESRKMNRKWTVAVFCRHSGAGDSQDVVDRWHIGCRFGDAGIRL